jgi:hypothetical protein
MPCSTIGDIQHFEEHTPHSILNIETICYIPLMGCDDGVLHLILLLFGSRGSSGSIVSDYGLDDRAIGIRSSAGAEDFSSSLCVQTGSGAHPASCTMGTGGPFPGVKRGRGVMLTTHPLSSTDVVNE